MNKLEKAKVLIISTSHITAQDDRMLQAERDPNMGTWFQLRYQGDGGPIGYMVNVTIDEIDEDTTAALVEEGWSEAMAKVQAFAKEAKCEWLRIDPDGPVVDGLETFDW